VSNATVRERERERHRRAMDGDRDGVTFHSRRWRLVPIAAGLAVAVLVALTGKLFVWPTPTVKQPGRADAVIVLAGGSGDRLIKAMALMHNRTAPRLFIVDGKDPGWAAANALCDRTQQDGDFFYVVTCPEAKPNTTRGEARWAQAQYRDNHWNRVVVVTSRYNLTRARLSMDRCLGSGFVMSSSTSHDALITKASHVLHEWVGWVRDQTVQRSC
jgi:uncharacterized SAM-binding protein YcdF (DUF218 family)